MRIEDLNMPPFNTTLMGVVKGALQHFGSSLSAAAVFGGSGHAFLINIHHELCPSGPYVWNQEPMLPLLGNLGLDMSRLGSFSQDSPAHERAALESQVCAALEDGQPCSLLCLENQIIAGHDEQGFVLLQPWDASVEVTPPRLTFVTWQELGAKFYIAFHTLKAVEPAEKLKQVLESLDYALDLFANPGTYSLEGYAIGLEAYDAWIRAASGFGASHGNWWNAMVWSECRRMACAYITEIQQDFPAGAAAAAGLPGEYAAIAEALGKLSDRNMAAADKVRLISETREREARAIGQVAVLARALRSS